MDETYIQGKGKRTYFYRAVDKFGKTLVSVLSEYRDEAAARAFFAREHNGWPEKVVIDKSIANLAGLQNIDWLLLLLYGWFWLIETALSRTDPSHERLQVLSVSGSDTGWYRSGSQDAEAPFFNQWPTGIVIGLVSAAGLSTGRGQGAPHGSAWLNDRSCWNRSHKRCCPPNVRQ